MKIMISLTQMYARVTELLLVKLKF